MKLSKLHIAKFRGASQPVTLEFDPTKKITMLFGENGMGKSSIADALVCLCTDKLGSISDKSSIDKDFIRTLGADAKEVAIKLDTDKGAFIARLNSTGSAFVKTPAANLPVVRHLRRSQIISLIDAEPAKRYEALKDYIDVANILKSEDELRKASRNAETSLNSISKTISAAESLLKSSWEAEGSPGTSFLDWAKAESQKDVSQQQSIQDKYIGIINAWREVESKRGEVAKASKEYNADRKKEESSLTALAELQARNSTLDVTLLSVLMEAKGFIEPKAELSRCPICEKPEGREQLLKGINDRIESMKELQKAQAELKAAKRLKEHSESTLKTLIKSFIDELDSFIPTFKTSLESADELQLILDSISAFTVNNDKYRALNNNLSEFQNRIKLLELDTSKLSKSINQHNLISQQHIALVSNRQNYHKAKYLADVTVKALEVVESTRKQFIEDELLSISKDVEAYYQKMHPSEQLGGIKLFLKSGAKNSLELNADFYTSMSVTPQSLYSESHLDTLGICIFMALAKKYNDGKTILILDDVVMSVDEHHLDRFIDLLHDEADNFAHILITTHYRPWKDRYRHSRAPSAQVHFLELRKWTLTSGIRLQSGKIDLEELKLALDPENFDRQRVANLAGTILENLLDFLSVKYQCKLVRKVRQDYTLGDLLNCLSSKLLKLMKVQHLEKDAFGVYQESTSTKELELKPIIETLKQLSAIRNQVGSHFNFDGSMVSDDDVEEFGSKVYEFAKMLVCPDNGSFPDRNKSGSFHETRTGSIRLFPLIDPN